MLNRTAARSLRFQTTPIFLQASVPYNHPRRYAKPPRPNRPTESKSATPSPPVNKSAANTQRLSGSPPTASREARTQSSRGSGVQGDSQIEEEAFASRAGSRLNTEPIPPEPGRASTLGTQAKPAHNSDYSNLQDEFWTSPRSDENTAPQSSSPSAIDPAQAREQGQQRPLPDLTQGIPSTLDAEVAKQNARSKPTSLNVTEDPSETAPGGGKGGGLPKEAYELSSDRRRNRLANYLYSILFGSMFVGAVYLGRNWENEEQEAKHPDAPSGWGFGLFYSRVNARLNDTLNYFHEPTFPKLLPDVDKAWERPYTLVLSLEDLLVHSEWTREHGWRMAKRPGVDYFLRYLSQYYELVIFTSIPVATGDPIIRKLDPYRIIMWPLFREATRYSGGEYIKDLTYLNRDMKKIILLDTVEAHAKAQPENAVIIPKWKGDTKDKELVSLIPFLEYVAAMGFEDTRDVLKSFQGTQIPVEYARRESIARKKFQEQYAEDRAKKPKRSAVGFLGSAIGLKSAGAGPDGMETSLSEGFEQGKTLMDQVRERGQKQYQMIEKEIRENGQKWLDEMAAEEKKMMEENMKGGILGMFAGGGNKS